MKLNITDLYQREMVNYAIDELVYLSYASNREGGCSAKGMKLAGFPMADICEARYLEEKEND